VETTSGRPSSPSRAVPWRRRPGSVITGRPGPHLAAAPPVTDAFRQPAITDLRVLLNPGDRRHRRVLAQTANPGLVFGAPPPATACANSAARPAASLWTADERDRLSVGQLGPGGEGSLVGLGADLLCHTGDQLGFAAPRRRPRPQA
jgi:hypothetical protein